jgi:multiple sugar transport system permease protein
MNSLGVVLALKLNAKVSPLLLKFMRSIFFFPSMIGLIYVGTIWASLFQEQTGIINYYLHFLGLGPVNWLNGKANSIFTVIFVDVWRNVGFGALIFLAALQDVPEERIEAAQIDGASKVQIIRHVTLPAIAPAIFFNMTMTLIGSFQIYESIVVLTNGGPGDSTRSMVMYIAEVAFGKFDLGYASALAVFLFTLIFILTLFFFRLHRKWVTYD